MPHSWKKGVKGLSRKHRAGNASLAFCRCSMCCVSLQRAKAGIGNVIQKTAGGKLASVNYVDYAQYTSRFNRKNAGGCDHQYLKDVTKMYIRECIYEISDTDEEDSESAICVEEDEEDCRMYVFNREEQTFTFSLSDHLGLNCCDDNNSIDSTVDIYDDDYIYISSGSEMTISDEDTNEDWTFV